jgi:hypothetical protein
MVIVPAAVVDDRADRREQVAPSSVVEGGQ